jgi:hypothetical protein
MMAIIPSGGEIANGTAMKNRSGVSRRYVSCFQALSLDHRPRERLSGDRIAAEYRIPFEAQRQKKRNTFDHA